MIRVLVMTTIVVTACKSGDDRKPVASGSAVAKTAPGSGSAATGSAATGSAATGSAAAVATPEMHAFCLRSMLQMKKCFDDDAFWDAHATTFFAAQKQPIDAEAKKHWIGVYKDSFVTLVRNKELEHNCDVMLADNQLPTPAQMALVDQTHSQGCAAFGAALGYVIYTEGAFFNPRNGEKIPDKLELTPPP